MTSKQSPNFGVWKKGDDNQFITKTEAQSLVKEMLINNEKANDEAFKEIVNMGGSFAPFGGLSYWTLIDPLENQNGYYMFQATGTLKTTKASTYIWTLKENPSIITNLHVHGLMLLVLASNERTVVKIGNNTFIVDKGISQQVTIPLSITYFIDPIPNIMINYPDLEIVTGALLPDPVTVTLLIFK